MRESVPEPPAKWTLYGLPVQKGLALGMGAPLYLPTAGNPAWLDPRLFAQDEDEWQAIEYRMPTEPLEVVAIVRDLREIPPVLAPYVRVVGWIVERPPEPPLPPVPILLAPKLPSLLPPETTVILDANAGVAYIEPNATLLARYQSLLLRTATHTRYHLESEHLPVSTWDSVRIQIGGSVSDWAEVVRAAQAGADLVWLATDTLPESPTTIAHALGGKPLWLQDRRVLERDDVHWQRLLRLSVELNLTLMVETPDALQEVSDALEVAREALRAEHVPVGAPTVGLLWAAAAAFPELASPLPAVVCWHIVKPTKRLVERLWRQQVQARTLGVRRALIVPDAAPETLAIALGLEPHVVITPAACLAEAKAHMARLGVAECREWLLQRLRRWHDAQLRALPAQTIAGRW
ncbi:MAG: hypothetical protein NZM10_01310 [Fimbriimonadales bacterium]|nr:hypothetical protein [Fimbriimonadales bacterium]